MGSRTGNWIRTVSRDFVFGSGDFPAVGSGESTRTVSLFGSFGPAMEQNKSVAKLIDQRSAGLSPANLPSRHVCPLRQQIVAAAASDPAPNKLADRRGFG